MAIKQRNTAAPAVDSQRETETAPALDVRTRIDKLIDDPNSKTKAYASVTIGGAFAVHGLRVVDSAKGMFVSMPSNAYKGSQGETKYQDIFHAVTAESRQAIIDSVSQAYEQALAQQQTEGADMSEAQSAGMAQNM